MEKHTFNIRASQSGRKVIEIDEDTQAICMTKGFLVRQKDDIDDKNIHRVILSKEDILKLAETIKQMEEK